MDAASRFTKCMANSFLRWTAVLSWAATVASVTALSPAAAPPYPVGIATDVDIVPVNEGGTQNINVSLNAMPQSDVTVTISRVSGDTDLSVQSGATHTFTRQNWNVPQAVTLAAAEDADTSDGTAVFRVSQTGGTGIVSRDITVYELENDGLIEVGGTLAGDTVWNDTTHDYVLTSDLVIPSTVTLTVAPGVTVRGSFWYHSNAHLVIKGTLHANNCTFFVLISAYGYDSNGIYITDNGAAALDGCRVFGVSNGGLKLISMDSTSRLSVRGCDFISLNLDGYYRIGNAICLGPDTTATIGDSTNPTKVTSFRGFQIGINNQQDIAAKNIARCNFSDCIENGRLYGRRVPLTYGGYTDTTSGQFELNNPGMHLSNEVFEIKSGGKMKLNPGSELIGPVDGSAANIFIRTGAELAMTGAMIDFGRMGHGRGDTDITVYGNLTATSSTLALSPLQYIWPPVLSRTSIDVMAGGQTTFNHCGLYGSGVSLNGGNSYAIRVAGRMIANGCYFASTITPHGDGRDMGLLFATDQNWSVTNCGFHANRRAIELDTPLSPDPILQGNDFQNSTEAAVWNAVELAASASTDTPLNAQQNWWGSPTGPRSDTNRGGDGDYVTEGVDFRGNLRTPVYPMIFVDNPTADQKRNSLTTQPQQNGVELIGMQVSPANSTIQKIGFRLNNVAGNLTWAQIANFRLMLDADGDGSISLTEAVMVGGVPTVTAVGSDLLISFDTPFTSTNAPATSYVLVADIRDVIGDNGFSVQLDDSSLRATPGKGIADRTNPARHAADTSMILSDLAGGQVNDGLNGMPTQFKVPLFGFRLAGAGLQAGQVTFKLSNISGFSVDELSSVSLHTDTNGDGKLDPGDMAIGGKPMITLDSALGTGTLTFHNAFSAGGAYLLTGDFTGLHAGDSLTIDLPAASVVPTLTGTATGTASAVTHRVDYPVVLSLGADWALPKNFGSSATNISLLGISLSPGNLVQGMILGLSNLQGINTSDITNIRLYADNNFNGVVDAGDDLISGAGVAHVSENSGTITFPGDFISRGEMIVTTDIANLAPGDELTCSMDADGLILPIGQLAIGSVPEMRQQVVGGVLPRVGSSLNAKWSLTWRSPGGQKVSGRFNHKGDRVILGYDTGSAWVYDAAANRPLIMLKDHYDAVCYAGFNSNDTAAVTVSRDGAVYIWDLATSGSLRSEMFSDLLVDYAVPSSDSSKLMVITQGKGVLLDIDTQQRLWDFIPGSATVNAIACSPNGQQIAVGCSDNITYLLNAATGVEIKRFGAHNQPVTAVGFTQDGTKLITASSDKTVNLWDIAKRIIVAPIRLGLSAQGAAVSPDGTRIAVVTGNDISNGSDATLLMFDNLGAQRYSVNLKTATGGQFRSQLSNIAFDDSGQRVLVNSYSGYGAQWASAMALRVSDGSFISAWGPQGMTVANPTYWDDHTLDYHPRITADGERVFFSTDMGVNMLFRSTGKVIQQSTPISANDPFAINRDGTLLVRNGNDGTRGGKLSLEAVSEKGFTPILSSRRYKSTIAMSGDGNRIALGGQLYSRAGSLLAQYAGADGPYRGVFNQDDTLWGFAMAAHQTMYTFQSNDPKAIPCQYANTNWKSISLIPLKMLFHPNGTWLGALFNNSNMGGVQFFDTDTYDPVAAYTEYGARCTDAAISDDGSMVLLGVNDHVSLYDAKTGILLRSFYPQLANFASIYPATVQFARNDTLIMIAWSNNYAETYERTQAASLAITPATRTLARGQSQAFKVEVVYDDGTRQDVTPGGQADTPIKLTVTPSASATVKDNIVTVASEASGQFTVGANYRIDGKTVVCQAVVTVGSSPIQSLTANPAKLTVNPGVYRPITYTAVYSDGYTEDVTAQVTLSADKPEAIDIRAQSVCAHGDAAEGDVIITSVYARDDIQVSATTTLVVSGPRTMWERYRVTGGGYGLSGAYSSDGKTLAVGSSSGAVNIYAVGNTPTQYALKQVLMAHDYPITFTGFLDDGRLVTASDDGAIKTWNITPSAVTLATNFAHTASIRAGALRIEGGQRMLAIVDALGNAGLFDLNTNAFTWLVSAHTGEASCVAVNGDTVITGGKDHHVKLFDRKTGALLPKGDLNVHTRPVVGVGFLSDTVFYSLSEDQTLTRWKRSTYEVIDRYKYRSIPTTSEVIGSELFVATANPAATWVYNADGLLERWMEHQPGDGKIVHYLAAPPTQADPTGKYLLTGRQTSGSSFSSFQFWDKGRGVYCGSLAHSYPMIDSRATADGKTVFTQDSKRTMSWQFSDGTPTTATRLLETGMNITPSFTGMDFTANRALLATRVGPSIFMYNTVSNLLWKTLHTYDGPFAISPGGTRLASIDSMTHLWDLTNLTQIGSGDSRACNTVRFCGEDNFLGGIHDDRYIGIWHKNGFMSQGITTDHMPCNLAVNATGTRCFVITEEKRVEEEMGFVAGIRFDYYGETYDTSDLTMPVHINTSFICTSNGQLSFSIAISADGTLALVGPSGSSPVKLIAINDGTTIREFSPPSSASGGNIGVAGLDFLVGDNGALIGWAEGYAELWRRVAPVQLILNASQTDVAVSLAGVGPARKGYKTDSPPEVTNTTVQPGQTLRLESLVTYANGEQLNVTPSSAFTADDPASVFINGSQVTINPQATAHMVTLTGRYKEVGTELTAQIQLEIVGVPLEPTDLSQTSYAIDLLEPSKAVYGDATYTFTSQIPDDCLHQLYIRTLNAHRNIVASPQLKFHVNHQVTVIVALDNAIATPPAWLADWQLMTETLGTNDPHTQRRLYQKTFNAGDIALGGNRDANQDSDNSMYTVILIDRSIQGTLVVQVTPEQATWRLSGPDGLTRDEHGTMTLPGMQVGSYSVTWQPLEGWQTPTDNPTTKTLVPDDIATFSGVYTRLKGSVQIDVTPNGAPWQLVDADGGVHNGVGDQMLNAIPTGPIMLTWSTLANYDRPTTNPVTGTLTAGSPLTVSGVYTRQTGTVDVVVTPKTAAWRFTDGDGGAHNGAGDAHLSGIPTGSVALTWSPLAGYDAPIPNPALQNLPNGGTVTFAGLYPRQTGTLGIKVKPEQASWTLSGPLAVNDMGTTTILKAPTGAYTIAWLPLAGWTAPTSASLPLAKDQTTTFTGSYIRQTGSVVVEVTPNTASWSLTDGDKVVHQGTGSKTLTGIPTGSITLSWSALVSYDSPTPNPTTQGLTKGATVTFNGVYQHHTGTLVVKVTPEKAGWNLSGPVAYHDTGTTTILKVPTGAYTITWLPLAGWTTPTSTTLMLAKDQTTTFTGTYLRQTGTVIVDVTPNTAPWSFTDGDNAVYTGTGDATVSNVPTGPITLTWGTLAGYSAPTPNPATQSLTNGAKVTFTGLFQNHPPMLSDGSVQPSSGSTLTDFSYQVHYTDPDGDAPIMMAVIIDGTTHTMALESGTVADGVYGYTTRLPEGASHSYYFGYDDGQGHLVCLPLTGSYSGPAVSHGNRPPAAPGQSSPVDGATGVILTPILTAGDFSDPDPDDTHRASQWQVDEHSDFASPLWDSGEDMVNKTQVSLPTGKLAYATRYWWRVRYQDQHTLWSEWTDRPFSFTTMAHQQPTSIITGISHANYTTGTLQTGKSVYVDRKYTFSDPVPSICRGQIYILTANGDKDSTQTWSFQANQPVTVIVAIARKDKTPSWLAGWGQFPETLAATDSSPARSLYSRNFPAGVITLGGNWETGLTLGVSMYTVIVIPQSIAADWTLYE